MRYKSRSERRSAERAAGNRTSIRNGRIPNLHRTRTLTRSTTHAAGPLLPRERPKRGVAGASWIQAGCGLLAGNKDAAQSPLLNSVRLVESFSAENRTSFFFCGQVTGM